MSGETTCLGGMEKEGKGVQNDGEGDLVRLSMGRELKPLQAEPTTGSVRGASLYRPNTAPVHPRNLQGRQLATVLLAAVLLSRNVFESPRLSQAKPRVWMTAPGYGGSWVPLLSRFPRYCRAQLAIFFRLCR